MRRNNNFNPSQYEEHLSPFGRKVLKVLVTQWKTAERGRNYNRNTSCQQQQPRRHNPAQNRTFTFRDSNDPSLPVPLHTPAPTIYAPGSTELNYGYDSAPNILCMESNIPIPSTVPTSEELVNTLYTHEVIRENTNFSRDDLINSAFDCNDMPQNIVYELYNKASDDEDAGTVLVKPVTDNNVEKVRDISWENMFDTELLPETNIPTTELFETTQKDIENEKIFNFPIPQRSKTDSETDGNPKTKKEKETKTATRVMKRKNQSKVTDAIPKKVKKAEIDKSKTLLKNSFRKQKYTKTVKNWLNDVDPNNPVDEEVIDRNQNSSSDEVQTERKSKEDCPNIYKPNVTTEKSPEDKTTKKVIQAQLTNKDGVMKFAKPKAIKPNGDNKTNTEQSVTKKDKTTENDNVKEKKTKSKFVAPIKSQIPVKDVTFEIFTVDGTNVKEYRNLENMLSSEIIMILVYSNGFCQLNNHHTEDTCIPEGILIHIDDTFYFLKGTEKMFEEILSKIIKNNNIICYEGKNLLIHVMNHFNFEIDGNLNITDAKIGGSLVDPDNPPENFTELQKLLAFTPQYTIATDCVLQKSAWYITLLKECVSRLKSLLMENSSWDVFVEIEMRLLPIISDMERRGVCVDIEKLKSMENILLAKIKTVEQECYKAAGKVFQINSTVQVRTILYDELQLDSKCNVKIRETIAKGAKSTSESMLRSLVNVHPLPKLILEYRHLHKAHATFLTGIAQHVKESVVKPTWVQTAAATGRIASNNPNLQAIPKVPFSLVMFPDPDATGDSESQVLSFRSVYVARAGRTLLAADFKHVECRVFAHVAADAGLLDALRSPDDLFKVLAAKWLHKPESDVSQEDRERTKRIVYASLYGAGARKLMDILNVSYEQALSITASFNRTFPSLKSFGRSVVSRCEQLGGRLTTICGRGRTFKHIGSADFALRSHAERQAVNFVVQGSAADLCKLAMVRTWRRLRAGSPPLDARLVLQIHDELVWELRDEDLHRAAGIIKETMESCGQQCGMSVSLPVAMSCGRDWGSMTSFTPSPVPQ